MELTTISNPWSSGKKIAFRFLFIYIILYTFPFPIGIFSFAEDFNFAALWNPLVVWTGKTILKLPYEITVLPNGSGDTTWNYVQVFLFVMLSVFGTLIWSIADRQRLQYERLFFWLIVLLRYYLAVILIGYGFAKIIKTQFPFPFANRLFQTYGESSPMGLLWTFMGYSAAYNFFTGMCEALAGFLLFFRHTRILGALLSIAVLSNIVMLNFTYDVPVKLFSMHLLLMSFFVVAPEWQRLINFFILNRASLADSIEPIFKNSRWQSAHLVGKGIFIIYILVSNTVTGLQNQKQLAELRKSSPASFKVAYEVDRYVINQDTLPPLLNDTRRWKRLLVNSAELVTVEYMDDAKISWRFSLDTLEHSMRIMSYDSGTVYRFQYQREGDAYSLRGTLNNDSIKIGMRKVPYDIPLISRGFHWINEYPFNR